MKVEMSILSRDLAAYTDAAARLEALGVDCGIIFESSILLQQPTSQLG